MWKLLSIYLKGTFYLRLFPELYKISLALSSVKKLVYSELIFSISLEELHIPNR